MASFPQAEVHQVNVNDATFWLRELSLGDWDELYPDAEPEPEATEDGEGDPDAEPAKDAARSAAPAPDADSSEAASDQGDEERSWHLLKLCLVHEDGRRATEEEVLKIPIRYAAALIRHAVQINGLNVSDEALRKNSPGQARD